MRASTPMTREVTVVAPELTLRDAWLIMRRERIRHLPVVRAGALVGILSDRDVLVRATWGDDGVPHVSRKLRVTDAMTPAPLETCEETTSVSDLVERMTSRKIDAIPVVRGVRLLGLVTTSDLLHVLATRETRDRANVNVSEPLPFDFRLMEDGRAYAWRPGVAEPHAT